jgi:glycosyltransferase involved in cell wall biosynthesis
MAAGIPVVATDVEGVREAVVDGVTGRLVKPGDAGKFATAIESVIHGDLDYEKLAAAAQNRHAERFSDRAMAEQVANVYREVVCENLASRRS